MRTKISRRLKDSVKSVLQFQADALIAGSRLLPVKVSEEVKATLSGRVSAEFSSLVLGMPHIAAKFMPYAGGDQSYVIPKVPRSDTATPEELPVPPKELWEGYSETVEDYLAHGKAHTDLLRYIMVGAGFPLENCQRILDFGCASGRMIRWLRDLSPSCELWGVDINEAHTYWCQQNLGPRFKFLNSTTFPHLPFEDRTFDFIYSGSVFTHISELADAWLLELKRITRPGGRLFLSVHDKQFIETLFNVVPNSQLATIIRAYDDQSHFLKSDYAVCTVARSPYAQVFYDIDYLCERWGRFMKVVSVHPQGYGMQTVVLLEK